MFHTISRLLCQLNILDVRTCIGGRETKMWINLQGQEWDWLVGDGSDLDEPAHTLIPCWMPKPSPSRNQCTSWFAPAGGY